MRRSERRAVFALLAFYAYLLLCITMLIAVHFIDWPWLLAVMFALLVGVIPAVVIGVGFSLEAEYQRKIGGD